VLRAPHDDPRAGEPVEVERVERLAELQHHVVRGVDDGGDRPDPAGGEPRLDEDRRPTAAHAADQAGEVARASLGILDLDRGGAGGGLRGLPNRDVRHRQRRPGRPGHLASDPEDREQVRPVRLDLQVEDDVVQREGHLQVLPDRHAVGEEQDPGLVLLGDRQLAGRAQHPVGELAPEALGLQRGLQDRDPGPRLRPRHQVAGRDVPHPHHDLRRSVAAVDDGDAELLGVRVVADLQHPGDRHPGEPRPGLLDRLEVRALQRQEVAELHGTQLGRTELPEPADRDAHQPITWNCSRNRTSLSQSSRMSGIPKRIIASRS
jgi:hypothetical protein